MSKPKHNAYTKRGFVQARVSVEEMQDVIAKAALYAKGNVSAYVREAVLGYRPIKKVKVK